MSTSCTLQDVIQYGLQDYLDRYRFSLPFFQAKAALALRDCRTAALGGHRKKCPEGHVTGVWYNSCRHRACPLCSWGRIDEWLEKASQRILPTDHVHVTCTLPDELRVFWRYNKRLVGDLLLKIVRQVLLGLLEGPEFLGAKPGLILNLHTWSRSLWWHIHVHCLITCGGWGPDGRWRKPRMTKSLLPTQLIASELNKRFTKALRRLLDQGRLELPPDMPSYDAEKLISQASRKKWVVDRREQYRHGHGVVTYLARYVRGGPIKNQRILRLDKEKGTVLFRVSRRGEKLKTMTLPIRTFIGRVLEHVPRPGYRVVRSCGLYHHYYAEQLEACREQLGGGHPSIDEKPAASESRTEDPDDDNWVMREDYCRICGCQLVVEVIPRGPPPPELAKYLGKAV